MNGEKYYSTKSRELWVGRQLAVTNEQSTVNEFGI